MSFLYQESFQFRRPDGFVPRDWQDEFSSNYRDFIQATPGSKRSEFMLGAGVGAGKTIALAMAAADMLNRGRVQRVMYVCPNNIIRSAVVKTFARFGINLVRWHNKAHACGEPWAIQGGVTTYSALSKAAKTQSRLSRERRTLVILDENHHLGDLMDWGQSAIEAFGHDNTDILNASGTPFRSDTAEVPFTRIVEAADSPPMRRIELNYSYPLGRGIAEGVNRRPLFDWHDAPGMELELPLGTRTVSFRDDLPEDIANLRLAVAVQPGSPARLDMLKLAITYCRAERRRMVIFVGGDSNSDTSAIMDAMQLLPAELKSLGCSPKDYMAVTSAHCNGEQAVEEFRSSPAFILGSVNMLSEGVDIPDLSVAVFLTSITATATTYQRVGRVLRSCTPSTAVLFMFRDSRYVQIAQQIEGERLYYINMRVKHQPQNGGNGNGPAPRRTAGGRTFCSIEDGVTIDGCTYTQEQRDRAHIHALQLMAKWHLPSTETYYCATLEMSLKSLFPHQGGEVA